MKIPIINSKRQYETIAAEAEKAVLEVLEDGYRTGDIMSEGKTKVGTTEMGDLVCKKIVEGK